MTMTKTITQELIENFKDYLINEEKSTATLDKYMRDINTFFTWVSGSEINKRTVLCYKEHLTENLHLLPSIRFYHHSTVSSTLTLGTN